jgi:DNA-binding NarL/FixJ family response regulator
MKPASTNPIRILIADDHPVVRDGLMAMLSTQPDFQVVGEASNGQEAVVKALDLHPDVLLLDLEMPGLDGVQALEKIMAVHPEQRAIVFTVFDTDERILSALRTGARGYFLKGAPRQELFYAIRTVSQGESLIQPVIASRLLQQLRVSSDDASSEIVPLSEREKEVLLWVAHGSPNKEIGLRLNISERTVKFHVSSILRKLNASNRAGAVQKALKAGIIQL